MITKRDFILRGSYFCEKFNCETYRSKIVCFCVTAFIIIKVSVVKEAKAAPKGASGLARPTTASPQVTRLCSLFFALFNLIIFM